MDRIINSAYLLVFDHHQATILHIEHSINGCALELCFMEILTTALGMEDRQNGEQKQMVLESSGEYNLQSNIKL